jgi:hypothetical protein
MGIRDHEPASGDPTRAGYAEAAGGAEDANDAWRRPPNCGPAQNGGIRRTDRRDGPGDRWERVHPCKCTKRPLRRHELVELLEDGGLLHFPPELLLSGKLERDGRDDPDERQPG